MHAVPPPMTGNYMPPKFDFGIDNVETIESVPKPVESKPKDVSEPKVWYDAPIIEEYESDSYDEYVFKATMEQEKPSCAFINTVKHVKTPRQTIKDQDTCSQNPKVPKSNRTSLMSKRLGLGYGYTRKACFDNPHQTLKGKGIVDSGCLRHMTRNKAYLAEYQDFTGGLIAFGGNKGQITGKGKLRIGKLDFEDVYFMKELQHFNLFFVSQMCDKKNKVLFTDTECLVLSPDFKLSDEDQVLLRVPRQNNMYSFNLENIVPSRDLACLTAKAIVDESNKWHRSTEDLLLQERAARSSSTNYVNTASTPFNAASTPVNAASTPVNTTSLSRNVSAAGPSYPNEDDSQIPSLKNIYEVLRDGIFTSTSYNDEGAVVDFTTLESTMNIEPKKISQALEDESWVDAMQEEL
nr:ribonuclease H-like domain-containing protein [Tanacetum cinerariifolium]